MAGEDSGWSPVPSWCKVSPSSLPHCSKRREGLSHFLWEPCCCCLVIQLCQTLYDPMDCSLPDSSIHGFPSQEYWSGLPFPPPLGMLRPQLLWAHETTCKNLCPLSLTQQHGTILRHPRSSSIGQMAGKERKWATDTTAQNTLTERYADERSKKPSFSPWK